MSEPSILSDKKKPRILFINSDEPDYLHDLTYSGLMKVLGAEDVVDYPWNPHYHIKHRTYPRNLGYTPNSLFKSLASKFSSKEYDAVIVASAKPECFVEYLKVSKDIPSSTPVIFIDGGDFSYIGGDLTRLKAPHLYKEAVSKRPFDLIFKREYLVDGDYPANVIPFPFSFNFNIKDIPIPNSLKYDVSFWAVESDPIRTAALTLLEDKFDCRENGTVHNQVFKKYKRKGLRYLEELKSCKIVLNFRGVGWDTLRYWEAPAIGRFMISQKPKIVIPDNFRDGKEIVFCKDDLSDLIDLCEFYLKNEELRETIARNAFELAKTSHSDVARAKYLLMKIP
ncbi:MAG: glycosyltransferase family 1 protein [Deltaproteobacteria bacterium]|nr:glycosyltransferase family 1 protein [Deltaproteobacteria bacterium]